MFHKKRIDKLSVGLMNLHLSILFYLKLKVKVEGREVVFNGRELDANLKQRYTQFLALTNSNPFIPLLKS